MDSVRRALLKPPGVATRSPSKVVIASGLLSCLGYFCVQRLSVRFANDVPQLDRPLFLVLGLFFFLFGLYLLGLRSAIRDKSGSWHWPVGFAVAFRLILLFSEPIQEVDIYRYLWDGVASVHGVSPFAYPPEVVLAAPPSATHSLPEDLSTLVDARDASTGVREALERVHFAFLPTVYPPVSQFVFAAATAVTPADAELSTRVVIMKCLLGVFDIGTLLLIMATLRHVGTHQGWAVSYGWCPLVIKEFANSGHLDAIAVFLSAAAVLLALRGFFPAGDAANTNERPSNDKQATIAASSKASQSARLLWIIASAVLLALSVGAKLYAVALVPLLAWSSVRRLGWKSTALVALIFLSVTVFCLTPMLGPSPNIEAPEAPVGPIVSENPFEQEPFEQEAAEFLLEEVPGGDPITGKSDRRAGLRAFLSAWMMNDFFFLNLAENFTPDEHRLDTPTPWFVMTPNAYRAAWCRGGITRVNALRTRYLGSDAEPLPETQFPFIAARTLTASIFLGLAVFFAYRAGVPTTPQIWMERWLECVFLTMAWFWLLLPTLNPWYWIWALPWIPFAKNRVWLAMSGLLFIYYSRFFLEARPDLAFGPYRGAAIFDFMVVWIEYLPWFVALIWFRQRRK